MPIFTTLSAESLATLRDQDKFIIVTHGGVPHADDILATALAVVALSPSADPVIYRVPRSGDLEAAMLAANLVLDVGGTYAPNHDRFDHHMLGLAVPAVALKWATTNGEDPFKMAGSDYQGAVDTYGPSAVPYSSFGLLARHALVGWSKDLVDLIRHVDAGDNGIKGVPAPEGWVLAGGPNQPPSINGALAAARGCVDLEAAAANGIEPEACWAGWFKRHLREAIAVVTAAMGRGGDYAAELSRWQEVLSDDIAAAQAALAASQERVMAAITEALDVGDHVLRLPRYEPAALDMAAAAPAQLLYLTFPADGEFRLQQLPVRPGSREARKPLPVAWAGKRGDALAVETGVDDATFCHPARFIAGAKSRQGINALAELAVEVQ